MRSRKLSFALLGAILFSVSLAFAEEGEGEAKGDGKAVAMPKDQKEFFEKTQRLNSLNTRIEEAEKQFRELVQKKSVEKDLAEKEHIIKQMNDVTKDRNKAADEYNKVKTELTLRYPNQGEHLNRHYQTQTKKSVEELEGAAGLDELLTRTKKVIDKKFAPFADPDEPKAAPKAKVAQPEGEKPQRLKLEK